MLIIEIAATNGAHRNQTGNFSAVPDGWAIVPLELEAEAMGYLPYIDLTVSDGVVTAVAQGTIPEPDLSALRSAKLSELSSACNAAIVAGCDVTLSTTTGHISLTDEDQINLTTATVRHLSGSGYHRHGGGGHGPQALPHDLLQPPDGVGPESNGRRVGGHRLRRGAARRSGGQPGGDPHCGGLRHWR